ncbi:gamma carbonic anhydrase family protein [Legionella oakridgensis]|uniref:Carbonic anhydrases/acetyltransferase, isoleucine patch superfamily n=2 Tax=Legionella oakridgensis TaxID=29423 RepID=W0BHT3_9GAMM|nr:gamma carbonic anhydrase family protein [Legionella oakridgensis]AHE67974.1 carbonic anhydrases/acetyltransferase, isoleucine patch superfamily [Legionella oakridgensis ATCC 33761 = DSM 21215]ETO92603.1 carbonic anhydrase/acetyltransferase, isoleucine patch superfamily [Legionella oakridgensis RV-2-2007]KTD38788.1 transferase [Legionella oakridgensis]STY20972.1 transferase [Legionella longbeachae]
MNKSIRSYQDKYPILGQRVYIDPQAVIIGDVTIGDEVSIWPMAVIRGDVNTIHIGNSCNIQDGATLHVTHPGPYTADGHPLILGEGVTVGHQAVLHGCRIGNYCLIGIGTIVLDGAYIEDHVMIAAGSLVPPGKQLKTGYLYLGNPARAIRPLTTKELSHLEYSAQHYIRLKNSYENSTD